MIFKIEFYTFFRVKSWADKLGVELWHLGDFITRRKEVQDVSLPISFYAERKSYMEICFIEFQANPGGPAQWSVNSGQDDNRNKVYDGFENKRRPSKAILWAPIFNTANFEYFLAYHGCCRKHSNVASGRSSNP